MKRIEEKRSEKKKRERVQKPEEKVKERRESITDYITKLQSVILFMFLVKETVCVGVLWVWVWECVCVYCRWWCEGVIFVHLSSLYGHFHFLVTTINPTK